MVGSIFPSDSTRFSCITSSGLATILSRTGRSCCESEWTFWGRVLENNEEKHSRTIQTERADPFYTEEEEKKYKERI